jgi:hypothetical protein
VLQTVVDLNQYDGVSGRYDTADVDAAQVTTSMVADREILANDDAIVRATHRPVLDLDLPAQLIPSSTPGHFHLYLDREVEHEPYMRLLDALADCGLIEDGYRNASRDRGYTAVRLPWVTKDDTASADPFPAPD